MEWSGQGRVLWHAALGTQGTTILWDVAEGKASHNEKPRQGCPIWDYLGTRGHQPYNAADLQLACPQPQTK